MLRLFLRRTSELRVRFCDSCAEVTTAEQRAHQRYERSHADVYLFTLPR